MYTSREYIPYPGEKKYKHIPLMEQVCQWNNGKQPVGKMKFLRALFPSVIRDFFSYDKML